MPLPLPNLDDRTFDDLINAAKQRIAQSTQNKWTDLSPGDPEYDAVGIIRLPDRCHDLPA